MSTGIKPSVAAPHDFNAQGMAAQIVLIDVGNFKFAPRRRLNGFGDADNVAVIEVKTGDSEIGTRLSGLLFKADSVAALIEFDYAIVLRVIDVVGKDSCAGRASGGALEELSEVGTVEDIIAEHQSASVAVDEVFADEEGLSQSVRLRLNGVGNVQAQLGAVAK